MKKAKSDKAAAKKSIIKDVEEGSKPAADAKLKRTGKVVDPDSKGVPNIKHAEDQVPRPGNEHGNLATGPVLGSMDLPRNPQEAEGK